jgi:hypothetical protein
MNPFRKITMKTTRLLALSALCAAALLPGARAADRANDFPTVDRVLYVQECMRAHPGPHYEMVNKCSCALDALAREVGFDDYVTMSTATNANSIGGERGNTIRDTEQLQAQIKRYREVQARAKSGCFISTQSPR